MSTENKTKINRLLNSQPYGVVLISSWLSKQGYNLDLQNRYKKGNWLEPIGVGAMIRSDDEVGYDGAIYALQNQASFSIHPGGKTALSLLGKGHYLELSAKKVTLFGAKGENLPSWFKNHDWGLQVEFYNPAFLPPDLGLIEIDSKSFSIKISGAARAIMECLYLSPNKQDLSECYKLMEGLTNLRPNIVQELLEKCTSIKVKRLFMYMAEKADHTWFKHLNSKEIDLGSGKRSIVKNGVYISKYQITVPKELERL